MRIVAAVLTVSAIQSFGLVRNAPDDRRPDQESRSSALGPADAAATFRLRDDLTIELVAAEPDVVDPVAVAWDEDGRMYVVEMGDYPTGPPGGRIRLLEDRDGDGRLDSNRMFADKLPFPTSVLPWRGGVLVAAAPDILFIRDTDGDGQADERHVLFTGFGEGNQQLRVNSLVWGIDNWVYGANGRSDGEVRFAGETKSGSAVSIRHRDFRFDPRNGRFESTSSFTQHGHGFDDWGHRFIGWNTTHIRHVVIEQRYLDSATPVAAMTATEDISDHGSAARIFPASRTTRRFNTEPPGFFNASCGLTVYRGDMLPAAYRGNVFVCEPLSNIVHRDVLEPAGATLVARRGSGEDECEFLASSDNWFRPVNLATGPDGTLYVVDFYRAFVEHPAYVRDEAARESVDWREGSDRGRIWRIVPNGTRPSPWPKLGSLTSDQLVRLLRHPNGWQRDTAQRLLVERPAQEAVPALAELVKSVGQAKVDEYRTGNVELGNTREPPGRSRLPFLRHSMFLVRHSKFAPLRAEHAGDDDAAAVARVHALHALDGLGSLNDSVLSCALVDPHARVREHAVLLAEPRLHDSRKLAGLVVDLAEDPDARVRFQVACSLGAGPHPVEVRNAVLQIARRDFADRWIRRAAFGTMSRDPGRYLKEFASDAARTEESPASDDLEFVHDLATSIGATPMDADKAAAFALLEELARSHGKSWLLAGLTGLADGLRRSGRSLDEWQRAPLIELQRAHFKIAESWFPSSAQLAGSNDSPASIRLMAIRLLSHAPLEIAGPPLRQLLTQNSDQSLQLAAARSLGLQIDSKVVELLLAGWSSATPSVRSVILDALLSRRDRVPHVVAAIEAGKLIGADLSPVHAETLARLADESTRPRLQKLLGERSNSDRDKVLVSLEPVLGLEGDRFRGAALFAKHCMACHAIQGKGHRVGPDLASVAARPRAQILVDIVDPNRSVSTDSVSYVVAMRDGRVLSGVIAAETGTAINLRRAEGIEEIIARSGIEELRSTGRSLMPEGLEQGLTHQDMADLLEFLHSGEPSTGREP